VGVWAHVGTGAETHKPPARPHSHTCNPQSLLNIVSNTSLPNWLSRLIQDLPGILGLSPTRHATHRPSGNGTATAENDTAWRSQGTRAQEAQHFGMGSSRCLRARRLQRMRG
jgi:hypothetical protein